MKLSELIANYGDDKVGFQKLDDCATSLNMGKRGTTVTFVTPETLTIDGLSKLGLVVWLDRERVTEILAQSRPSTP